MSTSLDILEELVEQLERGLPSQSHVAEELARHSGCGDDYLTLTRVAQQYELRQERHVMIRF